VAFARNINDDQGGIEVSRDDLAGLPVHLVEEQLSPVMPRRRETPTMSKFKRGNKPPPLPPLVVGGAGMVAAAYWYGSTELFLGLALTEALARTRGRSC